MTNSDSTERAKLRAELDSRYDDLKSGRVKPISGEEVRARLDAKFRAYSARLRGNNNFDDKTFH